MDKNTYLSEPSVTVGIVSGKEVTFSLHGRYSAEGRQADGSVLPLAPSSYAASRLTLRISSGAILWEGRGFQELTFVPAGEENSFSLEDVTIGVHFHWQRQETQTFRGTLCLLAVGDRIQTINVLPVEQYLESVISSEMSATSSPALLEAHAVISRSWLLAQMEKRAACRSIAAEDHAGTAAVTSGRAAGSTASGHDTVEIMRWYDREDHTLFDVCADDHCQRYQGITRETNPHVAEAVRATRGLLLTYGGTICDARFSKCCGGATEEFQYCWENRRLPYLRAVADRLLGSADSLRAARPDLAVTDSDRPALPDLTDEREAERWIRSAPPSFCNTHDKTILSQVLNTYDQETQDFYRWTVRISQEELQALLKEKLDIDLGAIVSLLPVARGRSGRLYRMKIVGTKGGLILGKELEIRRALSKTHLYSSAFVVDREGSGPVPSAFVLTGAGWGHGVGLCQIGAAVMGARGYDYRQILAHYYPGAELRQAYV